MVYISLVAVIRLAQSYSPVSMDGNIPYISDIGADILKPLFIVGCCFTGVGFVLSLTVERILRHNGRYVVLFRATYPKNLLRSI